MRSEKYTSRNMACARLLSFKNIFAKIVGDHVSSLSDEEFSEFELCSLPHQNISDLVLVDEVSISDMLSSPYYCRKLNVIGYIDHKPVIYYNEAGIYQWSDTLDKECLTYWISYPNSPPGWEVK